MNQTIRIIVGVLFLLVSVFIITQVRINPTASTPTRSTESRRAGITEDLLPGLIFTQELTAIKDHISGVEFVFSQSGRNNTNENSLLLLDAGYRTLYKNNFSSASVKHGILRAFMFERPIFIGKGNLIYLCLFSNDASKNNSISVLYNKVDSSGALYVSKVIGNDLSASIKNKVRKYPGCLMIRTYETDVSQSWLIKGFLYFLGMVISAAIIWFRWVKAAIARIRFLPEWVYLGIAVPASMVFLIITPPLQVPDEGAHFQRANEIAEFSILKHDRTAPVSILKLDSAFSHLHFLAGEKTSMADITKHLGVKLEPGKRAPASPPDYTLPYLPQALGVFAGKLLGFSPLTLMYLGRMFNLLISVLILFFAIRIIPEFKWLFLLLALMPKTLFLFGSLSYDTLTISLSFFTIAVFFYYAFGCERNLTLKDLAVLAFLVLLLLFCKPPYFLIGLLFFIIPPKKFGSLYKYIMMAIGVVFLAAVIFKAGPVAMNYFSAQTSPAKVQTADQGAGTAELPLIRPDDQVKLILQDIPAYLKLMVRSGFVHYRAYILKSFVGVLGWIDVNLPDLLTYSYLILIIMAALLLSGEKVRLGPAKKSLLVLLLVATFVIVETAMYVYATRPGRDRIFGVQGRYFIPMAPLFFMLFYNRYLNPVLNMLFSPRRQEYKHAKAKAKPVIYEEITVKERLFDKSFYVFIVFFTVVTLLYSIYITLLRYYNI